MVYPREGGFPTISYKDLYNLDIYFPSLPYQQQIVKILDEFTELEARKKEFNY
ncbi:restriction endonuclease subunit S [bacterium]|nr:restriction endonuclease subunit S [bacterium]